MPDGPLQGPAEPGPAPNPGDLGRRAATRREQLGLTREQVAERVASAPEYIRYVEERSATPGTGFLLRLADALETTFEELTGGSVRLPPGTAEGEEHPELMTLDIDECRALLNTHGVGRVAVTTAEGPAIVPVNYLITQGDVVFRTAVGALPAAAAGHEVAFEVDHIDEALSQGWSVLVVGDARLVSGRDAMHALADLAYSSSWAGEGRDQWVAITPGRVTGRRIVASPTDPPARGPRPARE